ncbi:hypothetical protein C5C07_02565 [Haloferax sp. Atlit-4N]|uniref:phage NrS-1 polymerase family protein n=1 Tax=Haloferax sp. Atlit-4N TaxID=2077206 RepID=UPI000E27BE88|nr:hypothetical protein [Haloferax sp. Atlit-4N]RDZ54435.1 hypothetical protein C5C07_02565 [Haloferax sp. Atlit-4N]
MTPPLPTREQLPDDLLERANWVGWRTQTRGGAETTVLKDATGGPASVTDPSTWTTFDEALASARDGPADGVGYVFTDDDPFVVVDIGECRDSETGATERWAWELVDRLDSHTQINPSGTGYHVLVRGTLPSGSDRAGSLGLSDDAGFFPVTGDRLEGTSAAIAERSDVLAAIHGAYFEADPEPSPTPAVESVAPDSDRAPVDARLDEVSGPGNDLADDEVIDRASTAVNGVKFTHLWRGDTSGYDDRDEADAALCSILAFWTAGDARQMCRLFRDCGLFRPKWDEVAHADGSTYGAKTVHRAIRETSEFYDPSGWSSAVRPAATPTDEDRRGDGRSDSALDGRSDDPESEPRGPPPTTASPVGERDAFDRFSELRARLDEAVDENQRLRDELDAERERRRDLEARGRGGGAGERDEKAGRRWSLFDWLRSRATLR